MSPNAMQHAVAHIIDVMYLTNKIPHFLFPVFRCNLTGKRDKFLEINITKQI